MAQHCVFKLESGEHALGGRVTLDEATPGKLEQGSGRIKFFLGNSCIVDDPEEAAELLIQREFPDAGEPDAEPLFIPDFFTSTKPRCLDLDFEKEHGRLSKGEISHVAGEAAERALYDSLKKFFSSSGDGRDQKGIMVLYSWQNEWKRNLETDFLIVSPIHKVIAVIEVKLREAQAKVQDAKAEIAGSGKVNQRKRAKKKQSCAEKIDERKAFFEERLPFGPGWAIVCVFAYDEAAPEGIDICDNCKKFTFKIGDDFGELWSTIIRARSGGTDVDSGVARAILRNLLYYKLKADKSAYQGKHNTTEVTKENLQHDIGTPENVMFYNHAQYNILQDSKLTLANFTSGFGTGKTILLIAKAKQLAERGEKVLFVVNSYSVCGRFRQKQPPQPNFLEQYLLAEFEEHKEHIIIVGERYPREFYQLKWNVDPPDVMTHMGSDFGELLYKYGKTHHIFIDEFDEHCASLKPVLQELRVSDKHMWIAQNTDDPLVELLKGFKYVHLTHNMRNCKSILSLIGKEASHCWKNFPEGRNMELSTRTSPATPRDNDRDFFSMEKLNQAVLRMLELEQQQITIILNDSIQTVEGMGLPHELSGRLEKMFPECNVYAYDGISPEFWSRKSKKKQKKEKKCDIVITYTKETRGAEFSSVILVEGDPLTWGSHDISQENAFLRATVNLCRI